MEKLFIKIRDDYCMKCNSDRSIELYDVNDKPINYSNLVDRMKYNMREDIIIKYLNKYELSHFKCKKCNIKYKIDWTDGYIPHVLRTNRKQTLFMMNNFKGGD